MPTAGRARSEQELKQALAEALADARRRTLDLVAPLSRADLVGQHSTIMSPLVWDLAHIGYFEERWLSRHVGGDEPLLEEGDSLYDAFRNERSARAELPLLEPDAAIAYLARVRERALGSADRMEREVPARRRRGRAPRGGLRARPLVDRRARRLRPRARTSAAGGRPLMIDSLRKPCDNRGFRDEPGEEES